MRRLVLGFSLFVVALSASPAFACGGMVSSSTNAELTATTALLSFDGSTERLLVQVGFGGSGGEEFAWLMPLPSAPDISEGSDDALLSALSLTQPPSRDEHVPDVMPSVCACGAGGGEDLATGGVDRLGSEVVGGVRFDTITGSGGAVDAYLDRNGFRLDPHQREAVRDYMSRGWVIVTGKVAAGAPPGGRITPVMFSFPSDEAVYPLAMAGDEHAGVMDMELLTLTPFRPTSSTFEEEVVRPDSQGTLPVPQDRLELVYSAPLPASGPDELGALQPPEGAWLSRYRAAWNIDSLRDDLVLAAGSSSAVDYQPLLENYEADARWVPAQQLALVGLTLLVLTVIVAVPLSVLMFLVRAVRGRKT
jgi:hypothetical protein